MGALVEAFGVLVGVGALVDAAPFLDAGALVEALKKMHLNTVNISLQNQLLMVLGWEYIPALTCSLAIVIPAYDYA